ncbi:MAG: hypothetical protein AAF494_00685 [Pseudomonadota bacterium]
MAQDPFEFSSGGLNAPASDLFEISPDDTNDLSNVTKALYVGGAGDILLRAVGGSADVTLANVPAGSIVPVRVKAVRETGTTATNIVGLI